VTASGAWLGVAPSAIVRRCVTVGCRVPTEGGGVGQRQRRVRSNCVVAPPVKGGGGIAKGDDGGLRRARRVSSGRGWREKDLLAAPKGTSNITGRLPRKPPLHNSSRT